MKRVFISQPMRGLSEEQIKADRENIKKIAEQKLHERVEFVDSYIEDYPGELNKHVPIWYLGVSIQFLSEADIVIMGKGWYNARGCRIEHCVATEYGLPVMYVEDDLYE